MQAKIQELQSQQAQQAQAQQTTISSVTGERDAMKAKIEELEAQLEQKLVRDATEVEAEKEAAKAEAMQKTEEIQNLYGQMKKHEQEKIDLSKKHEAQLESRLQQAKARENDLNNEIEKYLKSNEDLFDQVDALNNELDELRNEQIGSLSASNAQAAALNASSLSSVGSSVTTGASPSPELAEEKQKHATTQALLTDYIDQLKQKESECTELVKQKE